MEIRESHEKKRTVLTARQLRFIAATLLVFLVMAGLSIGFIMNIYHMTEMRCYDELATETEDAITELESNFRSDRTMLRVIAGMVGQAGDINSIEVISFLTTYDVNSLISQIGMLLPEDEVIQVSAHKISVSGMLDYDLELPRGEHISNLQPSVNNPNVKVIRNYVPVRKDGKPVAILYSATNPANVAKAWLPKIYDGAASIYVVDRRTGEVIINTTEQSLDSIQDMPFVQSNADFTREETIQSILDGRRGYSVFRTQPGSEQLYMCFMPFSIEDWEMVVFVPESAVFSSVKKIQSGIYVLIACVLMIFITYGLWVALETRRSLAETERRANIDVLTGLQNRNRYEAYIKELDTKQEKLTCLYIDANGLHELNNSRGHFAGDQMLRFIADTLKIQFGAEHVYRIGGDEFVVFQAGKSEEEMQEHLEEFNEALQRNDYHAAVGLCVYGFGMSVDQLIKNAEKEMYEAKQRYYERIGKVMRV